ncbi:hypothetical protein PR202_gb07121 [Eleusine coracana subsp. coracana]|uniref:Uncharacterized protein n=1 Tax=Eleusine coracana subsp. coracana TaxID=191504 RepID=A0AAV5EB83_ELECO|nr:hypothetical protein PR202_gb07121 [Eleusine coracana subsp. coracana]
MITISRTALLCFSNHFSFEQILALLVVGFGFWMSTHNDACRRSLTIPVMGLGGVIFVMYASNCISRLNDTKKWTRLRSCLVKSDDCNNMSKRYKSLKQYKLADLTPMESGCCRPPVECGYPAVNVSYFDLSYHPVSTNVDCKLFKTHALLGAMTAILANFGSRAGVAQYMKEEWRVVAIFNVILFVILVSPAIESNANTDSMANFSSLLLCSSNFICIVVASHSCILSAAVHGETLEEATQRLVEDRRKYFKMAGNS